MMKQAVNGWGLALVALVISCAAPPHGSRDADSPEQVKGRLGGAASQFLGELRSVLLRAMQTGTVEALSVCSDSAQALTRSLGDRLGVTIRRTSERSRNSANEPTEHDRSLLEYFAAQLAAGARADSLEVFEQVSVGGAPVWRLSKPIMVSSSMCLKCHGSGDEISPPVRELLEARYPRDRAQGYSVGDLRGMVVVSEITPKKGSPL